MNDANTSGDVQEETGVRGPNGYRKPVRRGGPALIGKKTSTTNAHDDYVVKPVSRV